MNCRSRISSILGKAAAFAILAGGLTVAQSLPQIRLDAEGLAPRSIEDLTGKTISRDYALAWRDLASALQSSNVGSLSEEFTGFAKDRLVKRITEQKQTGVHVRVIDHGHQLKAVFYSSDGSVMQLMDRVQLEMQTFDGDKLLDSQSALHQYMVLMTPGADRWYVRDLQEVSVKTP